MVIPEPSCAIPRRALVAASWAYPVLELFGKAQPPPRRLLRVGSLEAAPGELKAGRLPVAKLADGSDAQLPVILVNGAEPGPVLGLFACMYGAGAVYYGGGYDHGYEQGIDIVCRVTREFVNPSSLRGAIIAIPVINPMAFNSRTNDSIEDNVDMQQAFPGDPTGSITRRVAHFLYQECIRQCSAVINFHAKPRIDWSVVMTNDNDDVFRRSLALAEAYGTPVLVSPHKDRMRFLVVSAMNIGIPGFISEPVWPPAKGAGPGTSIRGVLNVMKHLGMLAGKIEPQRDNLVPPGRYARRFLYAQQPGLIRPLKEPGDPVRKGEIIGHLYDLLGSRLDEISSPGDGYMRIWATRRVVAQGQLAGEIFEIR